MPTTFEIKQRLEQQFNSVENVQKDIIIRLIQQQFVSVLSASFVQSLCQKYDLSPPQLALKCLPLATCYALPMVSQFYVGAVAIGHSGNFYFGANQEFLSDSIQQTIHAEQSALAHAWLANETGITDVIVNYTPCGHCRQFMNELNTAQQLKIHLPHQQNRTLSDYLPDAFGPKDLNITQALFSPLQSYSEASLQRVEDPLQQRATKAAYTCYSPYSSTLSGVALQCGKQIIEGRYAENAAFNPSLPPLQNALNFRRLQGLSHIPVSRVLLVEKTRQFSFRAMTESLAKAYLHLTLEYVSLH